MEVPNNMKITIYKTLTPIQASVAPAAQACSSGNIPKAGYLQLMPAEFSAVCAG